MIELTRFDGSRFFVNAEFIEFVEKTPDTVISLIDHKKLLVRESAEDVVERILGYQAALSKHRPATISTMARWVLQQQHTETSEHSTLPPLIEEVDDH
jgi:flagellar protein FlbD